MSAPTAYPEPNDKAEKVRPSSCRKAEIECFLEKTAHLSGEPTGILGKAANHFGKALIACLVGVVVAGFFSGLVYGFERPIKTAVRTDQDAADAEPRRANITEEAMPATVVGVASMYNPYRATRAKSRRKQTASGEFYDPAAWAAAIQIDLRELFGGVHYGRRYRPAYALVECCGKRAIVKINDVGPLRPGRVIDLDQRSMRYFDRSLQAGLIHDVKITVLSGNSWTLGPLEGEQQPVVVAAAQLPAANRAPAPNDGEQQVIIDAVALSGEERSSGPSGSKPAIVVAAQLTTEDWTPEPTGRKQLTFVGKEEMPETDLGSVDSKHFAGIVSEKLPGDGTTPVASAELDGVVAVMRVAAPSSRKTGLATAFVLISIGGLIVALSPPAPAVNTESHVVKPRSRRRRKAGPNTARTRRTTSRRKGIRKSRQKVSLKSRDKIAKKTPRKTARRNRAAVR